MMIFSRRAQTIMEYTALIALVTTAVVVMTPRVRRTTQSMMKTAADQLGDQKGAEQTFNDVRAGYMVSSNTSVSTLIDNTRRDTMIVVGGVDPNIYQTYNETVSTNSAEFSNGGWSE